MGIDLLDDMIEGLVEESIEEIYNDYRFGGRSLDRHVTNGFYNVLNYVIDVLMVNIFKEFEINDMV